MGQEHEGDLARFTREFRPGEVIAKQGDAARVVYLLQQGKVEQVRTLHGRRHRVRRNIPGELFGEAALSAGASYPTTFIAVGPCAVLVLSPSTLEKVLAKSPKVALQVIAQLARRGQHAERALELRLPKSAEAKVADALLASAERQATRTNAPSRFEITPAELATQTDVPIDQVRRIVAEFVSGEQLTLEDEVFELQSIEAFRGFNETFES